MQSCDSNGRRLSSAEQVVCTCILEGQLHKYALSINDLAVSCLLGSSLPLDWVPVSNCSCPHLYLYVVVLELETGSIRSVSFSAFDLCINTKLFTEAIVFLLYYQIKNICTIHTV